MDGDKIDKLNEILGKATSLDLFRGFRNEPSLICITFPDLIKMQIEQEHVYPELMEAYPEFNKSIHLEIDGDKITLRIFDKSNNSLVRIKNLSFDKTQFKMFTERSDKVFKFNYELIIGGYVMGMHSTVRNRQTQLYFDFCVIEKLDE